MTEKSVQTFIRAPNGELYCIDEEVQAFRSVGEQMSEADARSTHEGHDLSHHVGANIILEADPPGPEGAQILPDGMGAQIVPDQIAADTIPEGTGASIVPDGIGNGIVPDGLGQQIVPDGLGQTIRP